MNIKEIISDVQYQINKKGLSFQLIHFYLFDAVVKNYNHYNEEDQDKIFNLIFKRIIRK